MSSPDRPIELRRLLMPLLLMLACMILAGASAHHFYVSLLFVLGAVAGLGLFFWNIRSSLLGRRR